MNKAVDFLNGVDWYELGFKVGVGGMFYSKVIRECIFTRLF